MLPVECIARGYLAGLGLVSYNETGAISGVRLPPGLGEGSQLPEPVFTPTTKAAAGHDEPMTSAEVAELVGAPVAADLERVTLAVYRRGAELAASRGVVIADTKLEFGLLDDGTLVLADEVLTPDSSRFWPAGRWQPGRPQPSFDKQFVRDWLDSPEAGWNRRDPGAGPPELPGWVVDRTRELYIAAFERITGRRWQ
jgi:phosphoribosylaminoimidazole-succinocarboxamide synthase